MATTFPRMHSLVRTGARLFRGVRHALWAAVFAALVLSPHSVSLETSEFEPGEVTSISTVQGFRRWTESTPERSAPLSNEGEVSRDRVPPGCRAPGETVGHRLSSGHCAPWTC